jgi:acetyl esterase/lipase
VRRRTFLGLPGLGLAQAACGGGEQTVTGPERRDRTVRYGDDPNQFAELSLPEGEPRGVVVVIHGGFWRAEYDLSLGRPLAESLVQHGWAAWNLEYRRVGNGGGGQATLDDVGAGIDALATVEELDLGTVLALGHSAGGHLATLAGGRADAAVPVTGVLSQAGVINLDLAAREGLGAGAVELFLGHPYGPADASFDPIKQVPLDVPVHCIHGDGDTNVPINQSETYVEAARAAGADAALTRVSGDHFVLIDPGSPTWQTQLEILSSLA